MKIVADSSPLIAFAILGQLDLLPQIFTAIHIEAIKLSLDKLISEKIRIGNKLYLQALVLAGE